ncbi:protein nutcracker isoform X2 [Drosophila willistoni]|nr:protein nutcracker isoform X2 [Drosophila willistoni]
MQSTSANANANSAPAATSAAAATTSTGKDKVAPMKQRKMDNERNQGTRPEMLDKALILEQTKQNSIPEHLSQLMAPYQNGKHSSAKLLVLLIHLVALESAFVEEQIFWKKQKQLKPVPTYGSFHLGNVRLLAQEPVVYAIQFDETVFSMILRTLLDEDMQKDAAIMPTLRSRLMIVVLGDELLVTLSPLAPSKQPGYSVSLSIGRYVLNVQPKNKPIYTRFQKLDELSLQLKQNVFQRMRSQQITELGTYLQPSLTGMPEIVYDEIFRHLNRNQLNIVANVNQRLNSLSKHQSNRRAHTR